MKVGNCMTYIHIKHIKAIMADPTECYMWPKFVFSVTPVAYTISVPVPYLSIRICPFWPTFEELKNWRLFPTHTHLNFDSTFACIYQYASVLKTFFKVCWLTRCLDRPSLPTNNPAQTTTQIIMLRYCIGSL